MGYLTYGPSRVEIDDRVLIHLELVIMDKFRRGESFPLTWLDEDESGARRTLWMSPTRPAVFQYCSDVGHLPVNREWLRRLIDASNGGRGLAVVDADGRPSAVRERT